MYADNVAAFTCLVLSEGEVLCWGPTEDFDLMFPGETSATSFSYTFNEYYEGDIHVDYRLSFQILDRFYNKSEATITMNMEDSEIEFAAQLYAEPTEINAGDIVTFEVGIKNTGCAVSTFEVRNAEGGVKSVGGGSVFRRIGNGYARCTNP